MEDLLLPLLVAMGTIMLLFSGMVLFLVVGSIAAICVYGAAAHGFAVTLWRAVSDRGGAAALQGPDEPSFRAYYRRQIWLDLRSAARTAWRRAREETARIRAAIPDPKSRFANRDVLRVAFVVYSYVGLALGGFLAVIAGILPALLIALFAGAAWALGAPLRAAERLRRRRRGAYFDCPACHDRFPLPTYICPACNAEHKQLAPGPFGVLVHRCTCGARLPAMEFRGRGRLPSVCPAHGHVLGEGVGAVRTFHVPVAGAPSTGKSTFLAAALLGLEQAEAAGTLATSIQSFSRDGYDRLLDGFRSGILPAKTGTDQQPALVAEVRGKDKSALLYAYDASGELYGDENELRRDAAYGLAEGVVVLVDPFALDRVRQDMGSEIDAAVELGASTESPQRVLERLIGVVEEQGIDVARLDAAVCITKIDALGVGEAIGKSAGADDHDRSRAWLDAQGGGNFLRAAEATFREVRYFSTTALGRMPGAGDGPFEPIGAVDPMLWLLARAGVRPAAPGEALETQTQRLERAAPLEVAPKRPFRQTPIDDVSPMGYGGNFVLGIVAIALLWLAFLPFSLLGGASSSSASPSDSSQPISEVTPDPAGSDPVTPAEDDPTEDDATQDDSTEDDSARPAPVTRNTPTKALRRHYTYLGSGDYSGAFAMMSSAYRDANPNWPTVRGEAQPFLKIAEIGPSSISGSTASVHVKFYARDRYDTPGSDTRCRRWIARASMVKDGRWWRYDGHLDVEEKQELDASKAVCGP
jgi:hypothetical protein